MSISAQLRPVPVEDRAWLLAALDDALYGGAPVLPVGPGTDETEVQRLQTEPLPDGTAVLIRTSGSSGVPKTVALSAEALFASANATHEAFGGPGQWLVTLPAHLISGLQMFVRSRVADTEPVFFDGRFEPAAFFDAAERLTHERRYVSLVPVQLARLLDAVEEDRSLAEILQSFAAVLVGGQATPLALRQRAHDLGVKLRRSYGMSETAGGCVYDGVEIGDTRVRIRGGEVQIAGSSLALGYVGDEALTAEKFVVDGDTRWYRTGDSGSLLGGMLTVTGRLDRVIISGGVNVSLDEVERVVRELPGWADAVALAVPHPEWGERVSLVREVPRSPHPSQSPQVVSSCREEVSAATTTHHLGVDGGGADTSFDEVCLQIKTKLGAAAEPVWVNEIARLPRLPGGKPDLREIERWVAELRQSFRQLGGAR